MSDTTDTFSQIVGSRISKLVDERWHDSQEELAKRLGVHQTHVSAIKRGAKLPSLPLANQLVRTLGSNLDYLVGNTDDDKPASDLSEQIVVGVKDVEARQRVQQIVDAVVEMTEEEQRFVLELIQRITPK